MSDAAKSHPFVESAYRRLPSQFYQPVAPTPTTAPQFVVFNTKLALELGLSPDSEQSPELLAILAGDAPASGLDNLAMAYSGHQFGQWNPRMGDGRAVMVGEIVAPDGLAYDAQLKGSGPTPFARRGDGRATLSAMLREYIVSEAMAGLKIPTTRSLAVVATGDAVYRDFAHPGAVLTRIARSHIRVGSFQYAANEDTRLEQGPVLTKALADSCIARNYPEIAGAAEPYLAFYHAVVARQARLIAQWMQVGFIHGVMNTDNMSVAGETIDFGPCAFMDSFSSRQTFSSIDAAGRYAFNQQGPIGAWNLARLAETLLPLFDEDRARALELAQAALESFSTIYKAAMAQNMARKLGLPQGGEQNEAAIARVWQVLQKTKPDFTLFFRRLTQVAGGAEEKAFLELFAEKSEDIQAEAAAFLADWRVWADKPDLAAMRGANPIIIARNHRVEQALESANHGDLRLLHRLCDALAHPFEEPSTENGDLENPPLPEEVVLETYCNT